MVAVLGKAKCRLCDAAKQKLELLKVPYVFYDIDEHVTTAHDGWRIDGTVDLLALFMHNNMAVPTLVIDGKPYTYSAAMAKLRGRNA
jgi:glutaredoxin